MAEAPPEGKTDREKLKPLFDELIAYYSKELVIYTEDEPTGMFGLKEKLSDAQKRKAEDDIDALEKMIEAKRKEREHEIEVIKSIIERLKIGDRSIFSILLRDLKSRQEINNEYWPEYKTLSDGLSDEEKMEIDKLEEDRYSQLHINPSRLDVVIEFLESQI